MMVGEVDIINEVTRVEIRVLPEQHESHIIKAAPDHVAESSSSRKVTV